MSSSIQSCRWPCTILYLTGLRATEIVGTPMGAVFCRPDAGGAERWWIEVHGKGSKTRVVSTADEPISELALPARPRPAALTAVG